MNVLAFACHFMFLQLIKSVCLQGSQKLVDKEREGTVIFSPRICGDVDLEVGSLICIHPPWYAHR